MDKTRFYKRLNGLKDAYPNECTLIESIQNIFNKTITPISNSNKKALKIFPEQFIKRIPRGHGEWTTMLHIWAENGLSDLIYISPIVLTTKNSDGDSVLMTLILAATGKYTEQIDYDLIQKILNADLSYKYKSNLTNEQELGNVWEETDINNKTPLEYLYEFSTGSGLFDGQLPDEKLKIMLKEFVNKTDTNETRI